MVCEWAEVHSELPRMGRLTVALKIYRHSSRTTTCREKCKHEHANRGARLFFTEASLRLPAVSLIEPPYLRRLRSSLTLSGLVAGDSAICGRLAALILRLRFAGLRFGEFRPPQIQRRVGLAILKSLEAVAI